MNLLTNFSRLVVRGTQSAKMSHQEARSMPPTEGITRAFHASRRPIIVNSKSTTMVKNTNEDKKIAFRRRIIRYTTGGAAIGAALIFFTTRPMPPTGGSLMHLLQSSGGLHFWSDAAWKIPPCGRLLASVSK